MRLMKQLGLLVGVGMLASLPLSAAEVTVKGEIVDQVCYKKDKANKGADHKDCNTSCVKRGQPAALVLSTGYHANLAAVTALVDRDCLVISDAHVHASLVDAIRLSRAEVAIDQGSFDDDDLLTLRLGQRVTFEVIEHEGRQTARGLRLVTFAER